MTNRALPPHCMFAYLACLAILALFFSPAAASAGSSGEAQLSAIEANAEFEIAQRRQLAGDFAPQAMQRGTEALAVRDYEKAFSEYRAAVDAIPDAPETKEVRRIALDGFTKAAMGLAEQRIAEGRWEDAQSTVTKLLEYNPRYQPGRRLLERLQSPDYFNKTVTPGFVSRVEQVKTLLIEAQGLNDSGRFSEALAKYEEVLRLDRYNIAARRGMEQVDLSRTRVAEAAYDDTRAGMLTAVDKSWEMPVKRVDSAPSGILEQPVLAVRGTQSVKNKLDDIIIPRLLYNDKTIREVINDIARQAAQYDTLATSDADKGVNIVLKLDAAAENQTITLDLANVPLREALDYVTRLANLKFKVDPYAVLVVPPSTDTATLVTKEYKVPPGFITSMPSGGSASSDIGGDGSVSSGGAKDFLQSQGVNFDVAGASAIYLTSSSRLIVRNTQENLDLVDALMDSANANTEKLSQIEIESKFVEVSQDNLKELGFDWLLGQFAFAGGSGVYGGGGTVGDQFNNSQSYPFNYPGTGPAGSSTTPLVPVGVNPITAGNRSGGAAISANALDALLLGNPVTGPASGVLALAGVFTNPQFQVVLRALNQKKGVDVLSAPKVTTKSGSSATVQIVREFRYPEEYEPPQVPQITGTGTQPITPATPTSFTMKPIGVVLEVEPTLVEDGRTIDLRLAPEVSEFDGFINYGSPIENQGVVVTENIINYPVFSKRKVETSVSIYDGQTVALGGLVREDVQKVTDKTPILGDIPLAGALFRSQADKHIKRNLIIFVTASLTDPAGQPLAAANVPMQSEPVISNAESSQEPTFQP